jgi:RNA polymerase sigma-70 factor (ECF subfamily)
MSTERRPAPPAADPRVLGAALLRGASRRAASDGAQEGLLALRLVTEVERAWSDLRVDPVEFLEHVGSKLGEAATLAEAVDALVLDDLYLAFACSRREPAALIRLQEHLVSEVRAALAKLRVPADREDDFRQQLWEKLLVSAGGRPRVLDFSGRGKLRHWVRVAAVRLILDELRASPPGREVLAQDELLGVASPENDPEIQLLKLQYGHEFRAAFEAAIHGLGPEDRNVLRSYYSAGLTIDEIGAAFGIHRATAARRVARARSALLAATRRELGERLRLSTAALKSVMRLIQSQLHASVRRLLG